MDRDELNQRIEELLKGVENPDIQAAAREAHKLSRAGNTRYYAVTHAAECYGVEASEVGRVCGRIGALVRKFKREQALRAIPPSRYARPAR